MSTIEQIQKLAKKTEVKHAFIDLACLLLFLDKKSALADQDIIEKLLNLETDPAERLEKRYQLSMAKVKTYSFNLDTFLVGLKKSLATQELLDLAVKFSTEFIKTDGNVESKESQALHKISATLKI